MNKDQYLRMVEQTGEEIDWDKCPPDWEDFPDSVTTAIELFYELGDRVYSEVGFVGKDFTNLDILCKLYCIQEHENIIKIFDITMVKNFGPSHANFKKSNHPLIPILQSLSETQR